MLMTQVLVSMDNNCATDRVEGTGSSDLMERVHPLEKFRFCPICGSEHFEVNSEKSKWCGHCGFEYFFNPSASTVAVICNQKNELLVVERAKEPAKGTLDLPGGFADLYETAEEGVVREVREETGLEVCVDRFLFTLPNIYPYSGLDIHTMDLFFLCRVTGGSIRAMDDAARAIWLPWERLRPEDFGLASIRKGISRLMREGDTPMQLYAK